MNIPAKELRTFVDGIFPSLAINPIADSVRGYGHRYIAGHDLFLDVPKTFVSHGTSEGLRHAGHILLTDFTTKAGIPIPFFSHSGLGQYLEQAGIHRGWLQINLFDTGIGIFAISEGSTDLAMAIHGSLSMDWGVFFDTFVDGSIEVGFALATQNPFLMIAGIQNILAGVVATYNEVSCYVDPLDFFGSAGVSTLIGFGMAYALAGENLNDAGKDAIRSGTVGALFSLSPAFGFGALAGFTSYRLGSGLAEKHNESLNTCLSINRNTYQLLVKEICKNNLPAQKLIESALPQFVLQDDIQESPSQNHPLKTNTQQLSDDYITLQDQARILRENAITLKVDNKVLPSDPPILDDWYQSTFSTDIQKYNQAKDS